MPSLPSKLRKRALSIARVCSSRLFSATPSGSTRFLIASSLALNAFWASRFWLPNSCLARARNDRVARANIGSRTLESRVEIGLHLRVLFLLVLELLFCRGELFGLWAEILSSFFASSSNSCDPARACLCPSHNPKRKRPTAINANTISELPIGSSLFAKYTPLGCAFRGAGTVPCPPPPIPCFFNRFPRMHSFTPRGPAGRLEVSGPCAFFRRGGCPSQPRASMVGSRGGAVVPVPGAFFLSSQSNEEKHAWPLKKR